MRGSKDVLGCHSDIRRENNPKNAGRDTKVEEITTTKE